MARRSRAKTRRALAGVAIALIVVVLASVGLGVWALLFSAENDVAAGKPVQIEIVKGSGTAEIGHALSSAGVVPSATMFRVQARLAHADGKLKAGIYDLKTGMPYGVVIDALEAGPTIRYATIVIPEGFTVDQIAARVEKTAGVPAADFLALAKGGAAQFAGDHPYLSSAYKGSLEGYLFPKTYRVKAGATAQEIIEMMLDQFDKEIASVDVAAANARGISLPQLVTIASIIEREAQLDKERPLVASVIYNRLRIGMRLEIDATIEYILPGNRFRLRTSQLRIKSPYNTYLNGGLPPGPISSPGLKSLTAAAQPAQTKYLYYVLTGKDGSHTFTTNVDDFLRAKKKSKEVFGR